MWSPFVSRVHATASGRPRVVGGVTVFHRRLASKHLFVFALMLGACRGSGETVSTMSHDSAGAAKTVPAAPPELVFGVRFSKPESTYDAFASLWGKGLPRSLNLLLTSLIGLDPLMSGRLLSGHDWFGVVTAEATSRWGWALAVPVSSGRELVAELTLGNSAELRATARVGWTELLGLKGGSLTPAQLRGPLAAGVSGNFLIFGSSVTAVAALAPWLRSSVSHGALAPEQGEPGLSARLFGGGLALQALHAHVRDGWSSAMFVDSDPDADHLGIAPLLVALEDQLNHRVSAYLGSLQSGHVHLRWQNDRLVLDGAFRAPDAPTSAAGVRLCREVAALPEGVRVWFAGAEAQPRPIGATSAEGARPDWDVVPGDWQRTLVDGLRVLGSSVEDRVRVSGAGIGSGPWLLGWRVQQGQATALAVLGGVSPELFATQSRYAAAQNGGRVQISTQDGRTVEWAWAERGSGTMSAVGAALGNEWASWSRPFASTAWPSGVSPSECEHLLAAVGMGRGVFAAVFSSPEGLRVESEVPLVALGGVLQ